MSAWGRVKETAAAVSMVTTWRPEPVWSALSAKMVSCQLSYLHKGRIVLFICLMQWLSQARPIKALYWTVSQLVNDMLCNTYIYFLPKALEVQSNISALSETFACPD